MSVAQAAAPVPSPTVPALSVEGIGHSFGGRRVLDDVSFTVPAGSFTVLLGLNGAGKTTLFSLITRLYHGTSGTIRVLGHDMRREPLAALAQIGVVFQQPTLELDLSVEQNLFYHASLHGLSRAATAPRIAEELVRAGLLERRRDKVRQLSGGQRRRVELARALTHDPGCYCSTNRPSDSTSGAGRNCSTMSAPSVPNGISASCGRRIWWTRSALAIRSSSCAAAA